MSEQADGYSLETIPEGHWEAKVRENTYKPW